MIDPRVIFFGVCAICCAWTIARLWAADIEFTLQVSASAFLLVAIGTNLRAMLEDDE